MAYILNSNAVGMKFNDSTCIIANNTFQKMKYVDFMNKNDDEKRHELFDSKDIP